MNKRKLNKMFMKRLFKIIAVCICTLSMCTGCVYINNQSDFDSFISSDSKEETSDFSYECSQNKLVIDTDCSELDISKGDTKKIEVTLEKKVEGKDEETRNKRLDEISCSYEDGILKIISNESDMINNSKHAKAIIKMPQDTEILKISSDVGDIKINGDYDNFDADVGIGALFFEGTAKNCKVKTDTGHAQLDLKKIDKNYNYDIEVNIGDINLKVPSGSDINLTGDSKKKVELGDNVTIDNGGMTLKAKVNIGVIKIDNN